MAADYWKQRAERDMDAAQEAAAERLVRISRACRQASQDLAAQVEKIIGTYAKRFKLTRAEALEALRAPFDEDSRAYAYRLTRAEALARAVKEQTDKLRALEEGELDKLWQQTSQTAAGNAQSMLEALNFDRPDLRGECMALDTGWSGQSYSSRIWNSTDRLAQVLEKEITAAYLSGKTNRTIAQEIADRFSAAYRDAERLVRTEASYVANRAAVEEYAQAGCRYVEFLTAKDSRTCPICAGHDGDIVPIEKAKTGSNIPPLHPNCRCTVLPVVEDEPENELQDSGKNDTMPLDGESATVEHPPIRSPIEQRSTGKGNPNAILIWGQPLNNRQMRILERLPEYDARMTVRKRNVSMRDLAALTAETGCEYAMFTKGQERRIIRGNARMTNVTPNMAREMAADGWRWSGHTHPGDTRAHLICSDGDIAVLKAFGQQRSVIYNSKGDYSIFEVGERGDQR